MGSGEVGKRERRVVKKKKKFRVTLNSKFTHETNRQIKVTLYILKKKKLR